MWDASLEAAEAEYARSTQTYNKRFAEWEKKYGPQYRAEKDNEIGATQKEAPAVPQGTGENMYTTHLHRLSHTAGARRGKKKQKKIPEPPQIPEA